MKRKHLPWLAAAVALAVCAGCNLFNPSGPEKGASSDDAPGLIQDGTALLRADKPELALAAFQKAIAADATQSAAWSGAAKAALAVGNLNVLTVISVFSAYGAKDTSDNSTPQNPAASLPFANVNDSTKTAYLRASVLARSFLWTLIKQDSLNIEMDSVITPKMVSCDFIAVTVLKTLLSFYDMNGDTVVDRHDKAIFNLLTGNFRINPDSLGSLKDSLELQKDLIAALRNMASPTGPILGTSGDILTIAQMFSGDSSLSSNGLDSLGFSAFTDSLGIGINLALDSLTGCDTCSTIDPSWWTRHPPAPKVLSGILEAN
jgi:hypothetical protein